MSQINILIPEIELIEVNKLSVDGKNPNVLTASQREALKRNIQKFGFIVPIICNKDLLIADGQNRWEIAKKLGMEKVPVIRLPVSDVDRRILRQVLNKLRGEHDRSLDSEEYKLIFDKQGSFKELSELLARDKKEFEAVLEAKKNYNVREDAFDVETAYANAGIEIKPGEVFVLGSHRIMFG